MKINKLFQYYKSFKLIYLVRYYLIYIYFYIFFITLKKNICQKGFSHFMIKTARRTLIILRKLLTFYILLFNFVSLYFRIECLSRILTSIKLISLKFCIKVHYRWQCNIHVFSESCLIKGDSRGEKIRFSYGRKIS